MKASILFTLNDGKTFTNRQDMIKYLDTRVEHRARLLSEALAHKNASEILSVIAHEGSILARAFIEAEDYQELVRVQSLTLSLEDSAEKEI